MNMSLFDVIFSLSGRIRRSTYWLGVLISVAVCVAFGVLGGVLQAALPDAPLGTVAIGVGAIVLYWSHLALVVKRLHDHDMSGWWLLVALLPFGALWVLLQCGFLRGTYGQNSYGPDETGP